MSNSETSQKTDLFSRFVNWLSDLGADKPVINQSGEGKDFFSRLMNYISD